MAHCHIYIYMYVYFNIKIRFQNSRHYMSKHPHLVHAQSRQHQMGSTLQIPRGKKVAKMIQKSQPCDLQTILSKTIYSIKSQPI